MAAPRVAVAAPSGDGCTGRFGLFRCRRGGACASHGTRAQGLRRGDRLESQPSRARRPYRSRQVMIGMIRMATMLATLIMGLIAGPAVSLYGSPTVSPVTAAA